MLVGDDGSSDWMAATTTCKTLAVPVGFGANTTQHNPRDEIDVHGIDVVGHSADAVGGLVAVQLSTVVVVVVVVVGFSFVNPNRLASWQSKKENKNKSAFSDISLTGHRRSDICATKTDVSKSKASFPAHLGGKNNMLPGFIK